MAKRFSVELLRLLIDKDGNEYGGDPIASEWRASKKSAIAYIKRGVQRPDVISGWINEDSDRDEPFRAYIYKGDADITDQTGW